MAIRKIMTSVLLEATDKELQRIAKESLFNAKRKGSSLYIRGVLASGLSFVLVR